MSKSTDPTRQDDAQPAGQQARASHLRIAKRSNGVNREAVLAIAAGAQTKVSVAKGEGSVVDESKAIPNPWEFVRTTTYNFEMVIEPPFEPLGLALLAEQNSELNQCLEAMEQNIVGYGWRLKALVDVDRLTDDDEALKEEMLIEHEVFDDFLLNADYDEGSLVSLRKRTRRDRESTGNAYWEVIRDDVGDIAAFNHIPAYMMRLRLLENQTIIVERKRLIGKGKRRRWKTQRIRKRFRSFVQARYTGVGMNEPQIVHFREYGDPRPRSWKTGAVFPPETVFGDGEGQVPKSELASEIIHFKIYNARTPYGVPRYIGNLLALFGSRAAEEINYTTFRNNNIPSMAIMVSNGFLTDGSVSRITEFVESAIQGSDNWSKFLVIEAEGLMEGSDPTNVKLEIKPLTGTQQQDELFQKYDGNNQDKVRRAFRLPPIFVGRSDDYTRATADTSRRLADEQVFDPERKEEDHLINRVLTDMGLMYHSFETNSPNVTNDQDLIAVLTGAEKAGGTTPRIARMILEDILGRDLGGFDSTVKPDIPFSLQMADAVKNKAPANEVAQQVAPQLRDESIMLLKDLLGVDEESALATVFMDVVAKRAQETEREVVLNVGSQATSLVDGSVAGLLHPVAFALAGRELLVADGFEVLGRVKFGTTERMAIDDAAKSVGLEPSDVRSLYPGRSEMWVSSIELSEAIDPVAYTQPDNSYFAHAPQQ